MHLDPILPTAVLIILVILVVSLILKGLQQPHVVGYLLAGVLLGPDVLGVVSDADLIHRLASIGVVFLLFLVGMEVSPRKLVTSRRLIVVGTLLQIGITVALVAALGMALGWPAPRILLIGFAASLSSTAVVLKLLKDWGQLESRTGQHVLGILLTQDLAIAPMLVTISLFAGSALTPSQLFLQGVGATALVGAVIWVFARRSLRLPFHSALRRDR